ncbi:hypothetical protein NOGI109294_09325 [Nocardiopsis gilva]
MLGKCVEEGVGRRVVSLAGVAQHTSGGGEQNERRKVEVASQVVQVPGRVYLGAQHLGQAFGGQRPDDAVVQHTRRVHDAGQRVLGRDRFQQVGQRRPVGDIAGGDGYGRAEADEFAVEFDGSRGVRAATAGQQQVPNPVLGDQMLGRERAEPTGPASDQHGALGIPGVGLVRCVGCDRPGQPGDPRSTGTQCNLGFVRCRNGTLEVGQPLLTGGVRIHQRDPARVLRLGRADESPHRRQAEVRTLFVAADGHRPVGHDHQAGRGELVVGEPGLEEVQGLTGGRVRCVRQVAGRRSNPGNDGIGRFSAVLDCGRQLRNVREVVGVVTEAERVRADGGHVLVDGSRTAQCRGGVPLQLVEGFV